MKRLLQVIPVSPFLLSHISRVDRPCPVLARQCRKKKKERSSCVCVFFFGCQLLRYVSRAVRPSFFCYTLLACHEGRGRSPSVSEMGEKTDFPTFQLNCKNIQQISHQCEQTNYCQGGELATTIRQGQSSVRKATKTFTIIGQNNETN